jgi:cytochrome bd-type quinol oxidase subunit 2
MKKLAKLALITGSVVAMAAPMAALAQDTATTFSIESVGSKIGLGDADLKKTVLNILNLVLGLLTLVAVIMIIIGGFTWLTASGNEEKVDRAKKIISAAVIGLIIVLLAWAVVIFVARTTSNVTQTTGSGA